EAGGPTAGTRNRQADRRVADEARVAAYRSDSREGAADGKPEAPGVGQALGVIPGHAEVVRVRDGGEHERGTSESVEDRLRGAVRRDIPDSVVGVDESQRVTYLAYRHDGLPVHLA